MKLARLVLPLLVVAALLPLFRDSGASTALAAGQSVPGQYIVVLRDNADANAEAARASNSQGVAVDQVYEFALKGYAFRGSAAAAAAIARNPNVQFVTEDRVVEAVGKPGGDSPAPAGETTPTGVSRIGAAGKAAASVNVAVIDTGIDLSHPDLNAVNGKNCVRPNKSANDDNGHGSHVSGTIGAKNNGSGVVGVAPGTTLYAVKVLNSTGSGTWSQVICGINWVAANASSSNIKVANMSLGGGGSNDNNCGNTNNDALHKAICGATSAGVTFVVAAGNSAANLSTFVPAAYPEVLTVTAMSDSDGLPGGTGGAPTCRTGEQDDKYATLSNFASADNGHTVAGPGVCILSTWKSGGYNTISGTSMASPHVAGTVALCLSGQKCAGKSPAGVISQIRSDAAAQLPSYGFMGDPGSPTGGKYYGYLVWAGGY